MTAHEFIARLGPKANAKKNGSGWLVCCQAHEDHNPSLSVKDGEEGRLLLHCFAGCSTQEVLRAAGVPWEEIFPAPQKRMDKRKPELGKIITTYDYLDEKCQILYQVVRYDPKDFRARRPHPDHSGQWMWGLGEVRRVPYRLPELNEAIKGNRPVFIAEGEKDVDTLVRNGLVATCNGGGAQKNRGGKKIPPGFADHFEGALIIIIADKDAVGRRHAQVLAQTLHLVAATLRVIELPDIEGKPVKDAHDYFAAGGTAADLERIVKSQPIWEPPEKPERGKRTQWVSKVPKFENSIFYDSGRRIFWIQNTREAWIELTETSTRRYLKTLGYSPRTKDEAFVSPLDHELVRIQRESDVIYAGPLAGFSKGVREVAGNRVLVSTSPSWIDPVEGDFPMLERFLANMFKHQLPYVLGWWSVWLQTLRQHRHFPGQVIAVAGAPNCGKSLWQNILTVSSGGRCAKPYRYMSGATEFNRELFGAEHLMVEDEVSSTDFRHRKIFGARIKEVTVNIQQSCHGKNRQAITLDPIWRMTLSLNNEPENLTILPPLDESLMDKIMILKCYPSELPMATRTVEEKHQFWSTLVSELPALHYHLLEQFQIPINMQSPRFGIVHYQHPELLAQLDLLTPELRLLNIIDQTLFKLPTQSSWEGSAEDLEKALSAGDFAPQALKLLDWNNAAGTYLGRLQKKCPDRVQHQRSANQRKWRIFLPIPGE